MDFAKTGYLSAGESETVTITVSDYLFAAYDQNAVNGADSSKQGCYVFDAGTITSPWATALTTR